MKKPNEKEHDILKCLSYLPKKIVAIHPIDNLPEFILYELCHTQCFDIGKAVYLVENPDFDCCKGVAGYSRAHHANAQNDIWGDPETFSLLMGSCPFNQKVRGFEQKSIHRNGQSEEEIIAKIAKDLAFHSPGSVTWNMKHDNHGILIYEIENGDLEELHEHLSNGVYLFGLCPIF